ncbi:MAG TPA: glycosyltransferase family 4 protein [Vicinamibacterales bacterium]|nr:glycosyltransferase family 4 protein [Vicinamibacterales bacterium]
MTPHLPPDQAANALLPHHLGEWARERGDSVHFIAHPPVGGPAEPRENVTWIPRTRRSPAQRFFRLGSIAGALRIRREARPLLASADIVHVHSNGLLPELSARLARTLRKPVVLTLYGTEIWHYRRKAGVDLFTSAYRHADAVTFYSQRLHERAGELGLDRPGCSVIYPPVAASFRFHDRAEMLAVRRALGLACSKVLVNVKRLHPLAGQRHLLQAMPAILRAHPDTHLVICGTGALLPELQALARSLDVERRVTFAGLVDNAVVARYCAAADLFVLPSLLEALPTVAVEALASGTPVVSSDNPGGVELNRVFGDDVTVVPREQPGPLAGAIASALDEPRRTRDATRLIIEQRFRAGAVARRYWDVYAGVVRR